MSFYRPRGDKIGDPKPLPAQSLVRERLCRLLFTCAVEERLRSLLEKKTLRTIRLGSMRYTPLRPRYPPSHRMPTSRPNSARAKDRIVLSSSDGNCLIYKYTAL